VDIDEPLFEAIPPVISFTDYEPLQIKEKVNNIIVRFSS
jgi:hydrocephalus-inducing protein